MHSPASTALVGVCRGLLTGKFQRGETPDPAKSRIGWVEADKGSRGNQSHPTLAQYADSDKFWSLLESMGDIATSTGCYIAPPSSQNVPMIIFHCSGGSVVQVALAWLLGQPAVASVVIGARTLEQLEENIKGAHLILSADQVGHINVLSYSNVPSPTISWPR